MEAQIGQGPVVLLVMLIDVWLFASAFTVNTQKKKKKRKKQITMRGNDIMSEKTMLRKNKKINLYSSYTK